MLPFSPQLLDLALEKLGVAAGQLKAIDGETKGLLAHFFMKALKSGNANAYIKTRLRWMDGFDKGEAPAATREPPAVKVTSRVVVEGELVDEGPERRRRK